VENSDRKCRQTLTHTHSMRENYEKKSSLLQISWVSMKMKMEDESNITAAEREKENFSTRHINIKWKAEKKGSISFWDSIETFILFVWNLIHIAQHWTTTFTSLTHFYSNSLSIHILKLYIYFNNNIFIDFSCRVELLGKETEKNKEEGQRQQRGNAEKIIDFFPCSSNLMFARDNN
jgi:hypothetical protein